MRCRAGGSVPLQPGRGTPRKGLASIPLPAGAERLNPCSLPYSESVPGGMLGTRRGTWIHGDGAAQPGRECWAGRVLARCPLGAPGILPGLRARGPSRAGETRTRVRLLPTLRWDFRRDEGSSRPAPRTEPLVPQTDLESDPVLFICRPPCQGFPRAVFAFPGSPEHRVRAPAASHRLFYRIFLAARFPALVEPEVRLIPKSQRQQRGQARGYPCTCPGGEGC